MQPAIIIITDIVIIIIAEALKCDCTTKSIAIAGAAKSNNGLKKPFPKLFSSPLCIVRYAAKKIINPSFVISDGCIVPKTGNFIHLNAPFTLTPIPGIKTAASPTIEITQIGL